MNNNLKDILSDENQEIDQQKLMDYLHQQISATDLHDIEKEMADDAFTNDAVEGLQNFKKKKDLPLYVDQLNKDFQKQLNKQKKQKYKRSIKHQTYTYFAVLLIILLLVICINIIRKNNRKNTLPGKTVTIKISSLISNKPPIT